MDRLDELAVLVAVLDEGSLAAAARRLRRSPPAITRTLMALEERLDARLVERTTRRLAATEAGRRFADQARALLAGYAEAVHDVEAAASGSGGSSGVRGTVRVTSPVVFGRKHVVPLVAGFLDAHTDVRVELVLSDSYLDLAEEGLDAAIRIGSLADSGLITKRVGEVRRVLVASPSYLARHGAPRQPGDLARHDAVFSTSRPVPMEWRFRQDAGERVVRLSPKLLVNEVEAALVAARLGRGIARALSYQVADDIAAGLLVRLLPDYEPPPLPVQIVVPGRRHMAPRVRAFLDYAAWHLRETAAVPGGPRPP